MSPQSIERVSRRKLLIGSAVGLGALYISPFARAADEASFPPGWLPLQQLTDEPAWPDFRKIDDKIHLYLPPGVKTVRGVFICFVFHSADARELARLWQFALVTVPWPFEYDFGHNDKRNGRFKLGHPAGDMSLLLRYLDHAASETKHPELAIAPLVGWLGQNGSHLCGDLHTRVPERIIAWSDAFANRLAQYPEMTKQVPFAYAWEYSKGEEKERTAARESRAGAVKNQATQPPDFACRANTYGFGHGIYSKFNFFMAYLDRCIQLRMPEDSPAPGEPTKLKSINIEQGWAGDYNPVSQWNPIAPAKEARNMISPQWLPDAYAAAMWRSYHSAQPQVKLTSPTIEYRKADGKWGGPACGLGYGGYLQANEPLTFTAETTGKFDRLEFYSGDLLLGGATESSPKLPGVKLKPGLHALYVIATASDGTRSASRPAYAIAKLS